MTDTNITCPKCGAEIALSEAVSHQLRERLEADFANQREELNAALAKREEQLKSEREKLSQRQGNLAEEVAKQVEAARRQLLTDATRQAEEKLGTQLKDAHAQLAEQRGKLKLAQDAELELRKQQRALQEAKDNLELEVARKLDSERQKIADAARQQAVEAERLKLADKEQVIKGLQEQIESLKQRADQGSMQLQGESLEIALENELRETFRLDAIEEVKKGERGADITQRVRSNAGLDCGTILWEAKRAKNWSHQWPAKLKEDQRATSAELAVIVTTCPPEGVRGIGQSDGVWVCEPPFALGLAAALRQGLLSTTAQRLQDTDRSSKMAQLYDHLCGVEFRQHIQALVETFIGLQDQLASEQRAFAKQWKEREKHLSNAIQHTAMLYGGIQGIAGREALPAIEKLELPA
jgi:hypothetical protein